MSNNTLQSALVTALQSTYTAENNALDLIAANSGKVLFDKRFPSQVVALSVKAKIDSSRVVHEYDAIDYINRADALAVLSGLAEINYSVSSSCASIISDFLIADRRSQAAATDGKAWKAIKQECEASLNLPAGYQFPAQWQQYFTDCKKALELGFPVSQLQFLDADKDKIEGVIRVKSRPALRAYITAMRDTVKTTREERISAKLDSIGDMYLSEDSFDAQSVTLNNESKAAVKAIALANISRNELIEALDIIPESSEQLIQRLIDDGYAELMESMTRAYLNSKVQIKAA